jgi:hypothetical protein
VTSGEGRQPVGEHPLVFGPRGDRLDQLLLFVEHRPNGRGGSGIGRAVALRLASEGAVVAVVDVRDGAAEAVASAVVEEGGKAFAAVADVADENSVAPRQPGSPAGWAASTPWSLVQVSPSRVSRTPRRSMPGRR